MMHTSQVPKIWKHALIQPVFKKEDCNFAQNYRPISLTSICCKLLEHIVRAEITCHLDLHNFITHAQHGFWKQRSSKIQLVQTIDDLTYVTTEMYNRGQTDPWLLESIRQSASQVTAAKTDHYTDYSIQGIHQHPDWWTLLINHVDEVRAKTGSGTSCMKEHSK